jgi:hypothetical protein
MILLLSSTENKYFILFSKLCRIRKKKLFRIRLIKKLSDFQKNFISIQ